MRVRHISARAVAAAGVAILSLSATPQSARAQDLPLAQVLPDLILRDIILLPGMLGPSHVAHFSPLANDLNNPVVGIVDGFNTQMATQFSTFPLGSSSGGMTYVFDEAVGTFRRGSSSFGPSFAERALTIGRGKFSAGFNYQRTSYDTFEGQNLDDGSIKFYLRHQDCCTFNSGRALRIPVLLQPNGTRLTLPFEGDIIEAALSLKATTHTTAVFANYGVTERWASGLPFLRASEAGCTGGSAHRSPGDLRRPGSRPRHVRAGHGNSEYGNPDRTEIVRDARAGMGDIVLRTKYHFLRAAGGGLAGAVDVRLPTGDEHELLGAGGAQAKFMLVASTERGRLGQHVNIGYTAAEGDVAGTLAGLTSTELPDEINYSGGIEFVANPRLTLIGDVIGRTLRGTGRLDLVSKTFEYSDPNKLPFGATPQTLAEMGISSFPTSSVSLEEFEPRRGDLTLLLGAGGAKVNVAGNLLVSGNVLFPLTKSGLRSRLTTVVGIDYAF